MTTDDLILVLAAKVQKVPRGAAARRIAIGLAAGGLVTLAFVASMLGLRDLAVAARTFSFWMKAAYCVSLLAAALLLLARAARPEGRMGGRPWVLLAPVALLAGVVAREMVATPSVAWEAMWLGQSWRVCPWLVLMLAIPIFLGLAWAFRRLAPTRLTTAGAVAGLVAGAWSATLYGLHCPEVSALFVLTWYTLGIALAAAGGALLGPRLMRW